ncbi:UNVERIFIED_CONTAM: hypothetical protein PYX00_002871 [Menopon gallinae]|uniref:Uncharacterized protein n=1 Tax=Menopon gallinae TaxID=328185 RepID=A0AAW2HZY8_9NEOP
MCSLCPRPKKPPSKKLVRFDSVVDTYSISECPSSVNNTRRVSTDFRFRPESRRRRERRGRSPVKLCMPRLVPAEESKLAPSRCTLLKSSSIGSRLSLAAARKISTLCPSLTQSTGLGGYALKRAFLLVSEKGKTIHIYYR